MAVTYWLSNVSGGKASTYLPGSRALPAGVDVTSPESASDGKASPVELLAAALSSSFAMVLSQMLAEAGNPPETLDVTARLNFLPGEGVQQASLNVVGRVPGFDQAQFEQAVFGVGKRCPISGALGDIDIFFELPTLDPTPWPGAPG